MTALYGSILAINSQNAKHMLQLFFTSDVIY